MPSNGSRMTIERRRETTLLILLASEIATVGLTAALASRPELHVVAIAHSLEQGFAALRRHVPEMIVSGPEWLLPLRQFLDETGLRARIVVFGAQRHLGANAGRTAAVACGYVSYLTPSRTYLPMVDVIANCPQPVMLTEPAQCRSCTARPSLKPPKLQLTHRELQVFVAIGEGFRSADIACELGISVKTVEAHRESIKAKLALGSARELSAAAADWCRGGSS
jgi:DNA-binding NarL/FixJ family response regulator